MEDHNFDDPSRFDTVTATVQSPGSGDIEAITLVDRGGLVHEGRPDLDPTKRDLAAPIVAGGTPDLLEAIALRRPTVLVGTTGVGATFGRQVIEAMAAHVPVGDRPIVLPLSNPTSAAEATPADVIGWTDGRALVATGSPFAAVSHGGRRHEIGQANNVFVFPGIGLGAVVAEASVLTDAMFLRAAHVLADSVTDERLSTGALYPPISMLREVSRRVAIAVAGPDRQTDVDAAIWWPDYVPYVPARAAERRRTRSA